MTSQQSLAPYVLLVEGKDDERFIWQFIASSFHESDFQIVVGEGKSGIPGTLAAKVKESGFYDTVKAVGIVRDADTDPAAAFQSCCGAFARAGLDVPELPGVFTTGVPRTGALILPSADARGELETLCLQAIEAAPGAKKNMACVDGYVTCLESAGLSIKRREKTRLYTFLAAKPEPSLKLGEAFQAGYIPLNAAAFDGVRAFLAAMTGDS